MNFSAWAPGAKAVELVVGERRFAMQPAGEGYWSVELPESQAEAGYKFSIDRAPPIPDPRSRWQPQGVHGASHVLDAKFYEHRDLLQHGAGAFRQVPLQDAVIYEIHVGTFTTEGTYRAAQAKLAHLIALGVTHVELLPIATFPGQHGWGYDGVDLYAPFPAYGTPQELADFIQACHAGGIAVLLDVVYNHLGPDGNYLGQFGDYFTDRYKTGWGSAINYDGPHSDAVRRFVIDNALMWLRDYRFDGLRLDAVHAIFSFDAVHVLEELSTAVARMSGELGRPLVLIAESDLNDPRFVRAVAKGGYGLDAHWCDDFHHAVHAFFTAERSGYYVDFNGLEDLATALRDGYVYQGRYSEHRRRRHGRVPSGVGPEQLVVSAQNHDQIGNRAQGERLSMMLTVPQLKAVAAATMLSPFVPMLFQGEEWGAKTPFLYFTDHENPELGRLVAEGRSKEFLAFAWQGSVPNPQAADTFLRSKLDWSELADSTHADLFEWYRRLSELRRDKKAVRLGATRAAKAVVKFDVRDNWLKINHGGLLTVFNFGEVPRKIPLPVGNWQLMLASDSVEPDGKMPARATAVYKRGGAL